MVLHAHRPGHDAVGLPATYTLTVIGCPTDIFTTRVKMHQNLGLTTHTTITSMSSATFNVPPLATDSTLHLAFGYFVNDARFHTMSLTFAAGMP